MNSSTSLTIKSASLISEFWKFLDLILLNSSFSFSAKKSTAEINFGLFSFSAFSASASAISASASSSPSI